MVPQKAPMKIGDYRRLRETLGCSLLELMYLVGSQRRPLSPKADEAIGSLPKRYLLRLLLGQPELVDGFFPKMPDFTTIYPLLENNWPDKFGRFSIRKCAVLFGVIPATVYSWRNGKEPSLTVVKLFYFLNILMKRYGKAGLRLYLECIEADIIANGISGGLQEAFKNPELAYKQLNSHQNPAFESDDQ